MVITVSQALRTTPKGFTNLTATVEAALQTSGLHNGICQIFCPHTTAAVTINENSDPDVRHDLMLGLETAFPDQPAFMHAEGNAAAHLKAAVIGSSVSVPFRDGKLLLGIWQAIYFCEFDGPRNRRYLITLVGD
ncbi:MAG: secondary thiamine-phosphate synthase enzyme YjbQ [Oscillospiraceae bacterium]|nr:secondary thiamine-phosphate synthase enzyme YjbQ [Oscillospiraceae bacterium]MDD4368704.1 secondary thiamine-phosphate synthase enzyme YjbQ [Oscillospiraceae bacterium]